MLQRCMECGGDVSVFATALAIRSGGTATTLVGGPVGAVAPAAAPAVQQTGAASAPKVKAPSSEPRLEKTQRVSSPAGVSGKSGGKAKVKARVEESSPKITSPATAATASPRSSGHSGTDRLSLSAGGGAGPAGVDKAATEAALAAAEREIAAGRLNVSDEEQVALGYLQVNTGRYDQGIELFDKLLRRNPKMLGALLGRGTAQARRATQTL